MTNPGLALDSSSVGNSDATAFEINDSDMSSGHKLMLKSGTYTGGGATESNLSTLTLKRLVPGNRYLVQLWAHDARTSGGNGTNAKNRYVDVDGVVRMEFQNVGLFSPARGDVATGIFTATGTAHRP